MAENSTEINWRRELGSEMQDSTYYYPLHKDPDTVGGFVLRAVYKTLTGDEIVTQGENEWIHDSTSIRDEQTEVLARGLFDQVKAIRRANGGEDIDREEATNQSHRAVEALRQGREFTASYDYWGMSPIKADVGLHNMNGYPDYFLASAKLATTGDLVGFPYQILGRTLKNESGVNTLDFMIQAVSRLGMNPEEVLQRMYADKGKMAFVMAMNDAGHTNFDSIRTAIVYSGEREHRLFTLEEMFKMVSKREREIVQRPRQGERLYAQVNKVIEAGQSSGRLEISLHTQGSIRYDPESKSIKGEVTLDQYDAVYASVRSLITPNTRHEDLLEVRKQAQVIVKDLGFPEPSRSLYW